MAHYSAIKRNEVLIHITPQINLENVPSERSQRQNAPPLHGSMYIKCAEKGTLERQKVG